MKQSLSWRYYNPIFNYENLFPQLAQLSAWTGHRRFAYDWTRFQNPRTVVELGTYVGVSFFSFCQAAVDSGSGARCYAIDTWMGDAHSGYYPETVYAMFNQAVDAYYRTTAVPLRNTFDGANALFADESIDLLHIDGFHSYEESLHDYTTWLPKLAKNGVVLLHDIAEMGKGFGVYRLWEELKVYPHMEFHHAHGLGVVCPKGCPEPLRKVFANAGELRQAYANG